MTKKIRVIRIMIMINNVDDEDDNGEYEDKDSDADDVFRHTAAGLGGLATRVAGLLAPSVNLLVVYHYSIPISVFSSLTLLGGALIFLLPETRGIELADSTAQAEIQR